MQDPIHTYTGDEDDGQAMNVLSGESSILQASKP